MIRRPPRSTLYPNPTLFPPTITVLKQTNDFFGLTLVELKNSQTNLIATANNLTADNKTSAITFTALKNNNTNLAHTITVLKQTNTISSATPVELKDSTTKQS